VNAGVICINVGFISELVSCSNVVSQVDEEEQEEVEEELVVEGFVVFAGGEMVVGGVVEVEVEEPSESDSSDC